MNAEQSILVTFDDTEGTLSAFSGKYRDWRYTATQRGTSNTVLGQCAINGEVIRRTLPTNMSSWKSFSSADMQSTLGIAVPFSVKNLLAVPLMAVDRGAMTADLAAIAARKKASKSCNKANPAAR